MVASCGPKKEDSTEIVNETTLDSIPEQLTVQDTVAVQSNEEITKVVAKEVTTGTVNNQKSKAEAPSKIEVTKNTTTEEVVKNEELSNDVDHSLWNTLLKKNVSSNGKVNYKGFINDKEQLEAYLKKLAVKIPDASWSRNAKLAYWINVYNAFTVKLIVDNYPVKSIKNIANPWGKKFIILENIAYSLEQIENDVLRKMNEPRIHFAINCASYSCPDLLNSAYIPGSLESQLTSVTKRFINDSSKNKLDENEVKVSEIFNWYSDDFKTKNTTVLDFITKYTNVTINDGAKISFVDYNWSLNE